jgi:hypothetical protein
MYAELTVAVQINIEPNTLGGVHRHGIKDARLANVEVEIMANTRALVLMVVNLKLTLIGFQERFMRCCMTR